MITKKQHHRVVSRRWCSARRWAVEALEARFCLTSYTTLDLIPLPEDDSTSAGALNDNGLAVGHSYTYGSADRTARSAVAWQVDDVGNVTVSQLPEPDGDDSHESYQAADVNNLGMIVGEWVAVRGGPSYAVLWTMDSSGAYVAHQLAEGQPADVYSHAGAISEPDPNGNVWVLGDLDTDPAVLWKVTVTGAGDVSWTHYSLGDAMALDASDVQVIDSYVYVVGHAINGAAVWQLDLDGNLVSRTDLGTLGGGFSWGYAINGQSAVVGASYLADPHFVNPFLYEVGTTTVHVGDLDGISTSGSRGKWNATVTITVHSGGETPLEGATVSGTWSAGATGSSSCVTDAAGQCSVTKGKLSGSSVTFTVDTITLSGATYAPADNHDPDGDSSGTVITVSSGTSAATIAAAIASQGTLQSVDTVFETVADDSGTTEKDDPLLPRQRMNMAAVARLAVSVAASAAEDRIAALGFDAVLVEDGGLKEASLLDREFDDFIRAGWM